MALSVCLAVFPKFLSQIFASNFGHRFLNKALQLLLNSGLFNSIKDKLKIMEVQVKKTVKYCLPIFPRGVEFPWVPWVGSDPFGSERSACVLERIMKFTKRFGFNPKRIWNPSFTLTIQKVVFFKVTKIAQSFLDENDKGAYQSIKMCSMYKTIYKFDFHAKLNIVCETVDRIVNNKCSNCFQTLLTVFVIGSRIHHNKQQII